MNQFESKGRLAAARLSWIAGVCLVAIAAAQPAQAATITFAPGDYDNTANTVTGTNAAPVYNGKQTTGQFRDAYWWGSAYGQSHSGLGSPDFINSGQNLVSNTGQGVARAVVGGDNTALNFTGVKIANGGTSFLTVYDTTPGVAGQSNLFGAAGGLELSADVLFAPGQHAAQGGIVSFYQAGQSGLTLLAGNGGGNNADVLRLGVVSGEFGAVTTLASVSLNGSNLLGDTSRQVLTGDLSGDHWYRLVMNLTTTGDTFNVNGFLYGHSNATDPNSSLLGGPIAQLFYSGSLSNPGYGLNLASPGEIGLMAHVKGPFGDGVANGWTGADPHVDNVGVSMTNFTYPTGNVPEPATWAMMILGFGGIGAALRRRRRIEAIAA